MTEKLYCLLEGLVGVVAAGLWSGVGGVGVARSGCYHSCVQAQDKERLHEVSPRTPRGQRTDE